MTGRGKTVALLVAAGSGTRAGGALPKQYRELGGKSVLRWAVEPFVEHARVDAVRVVIGSGQEALALKALAGLDVGELIIGAEKRASSVFNGLQALSADTACVLIHDAARPFCPLQVIDRLIDALDHHDGAVPVIRTADTLTRVTRTGTIGEWVDRDEIVRVQTPQAFVLRTLASALDDWRGATPPTDEAAYLRAKRIPIAVVDGDQMLDKLTYEADFEAVEARLARRLVSRTGLGFDVHALAEGKELWLAGLLIPHDRGLKGHSDADVVLHALTDAILGAIGAGDIGDHFPPSDPKWRGAASSQFVEHAVGLVTQRGGRIDHADMTIICEAPRIGPHRAAMRAHVAGLLRLPLGRISVKATTTERLGFTGRGEGIAAQAVVTIRMPEDL